MELDALVFGGGGGRGKGGVEGGGRFFFLGTPSHSSATSVCFEVL